MFEQEEQTLLPQKIDLNQALFIQFRRELARSPFFIPFILLIVLLFFIGLMHSTGILPIHRLLNISESYHGVESPSYFEK